MESTRREDRTLGRIVTTLVALAALAEAAAGRSFPVRWLVLLFLRRAENVAQDFVAATAGLAWPGSEVRPETGSGPADAVSLALRLRMLAALLGAFLWQRCRLNRSGAGAASRLLATRHAPCPAMAGGPPPPSAPDTS